MAKGLRRWLGLAASAIVLGLVFLHFSRGEEWKGFRWDLLWRSLAGMRTGYLAVAVAGVYASYVVRAYRWQFFVNPLKRVSLWVLFVGHILGFGAVYTIGRAGELVRPAYIARRAELPFTAMAAVWLLERIFDNICITVLFSAALFFGPLKPATEWERAVLSEMRWIGVLVFTGSLLFVLFLVHFRLSAPRMTARLVGLLRVLPERARLQLEKFVQSFAQGLEVIQTWKDLALTVVSTAALWLINVGVFKLVLRGMGGDLARLDWMASIFILYLAVLGMLIQLPGIGGGFQVVALRALNGFFKIGLESATGAAVLLWLVISFPCLLLALVLLVHEGLSFRKLKAIAVEEKATAARP